MAKERRKQRTRRDIGTTVSPLFLGIICLTIGCTRQIYVPVERCVRDTVSVIRERVDTLMARDSVHIESRGDTTVKEVYKWRLRTRTRTDTVYRTRTDTISLPPHPAAIPEVKKEKKKNRASVIAGIITWGTRGVMLLTVIILLLRRRRRRQA